MNIQPNTEALRNLMSVLQVREWKLKFVSGLLCFGLPCGSAGKESACNVGHLGLIPGLGRSPGEENAYPL